jgi:hypothetical protein
MFLAACGSAAYGTSPTKISVGGTYSTVVSLTANTCGSSITVQNNNTVVTHSAGATGFGMQHASVNYTGQLDLYGHFTTNVVQVVAQDGTSTSSLSVVGDFSTTGFVADVNVSVVRNTPPNCAYTVHWIGTRQGGTNTIP